LYNDQRFLNYANIVNVVNSNTTKIVMGQEQLITAINLYLENINFDSVSRKKLLQLQVSKLLQGTSKRIAETPTAVVIKKLLFFTITNFYPKE